MRIGLGATHCAARYGGEAWQNIFGALLRLQAVAFFPLVLSHIGKFGVQGVFFAPAITDIGLLILFTFMVASQFRSMTAQKKVL
jgi:hypothetical protein